MMSLAPKVANLITENLRVCELFRNEREPEVSLHCYIFPGDMIARGIDALNVQLMYEFPPHLPTWITTIH